MSKKYLSLEEAAKLLGMKTEELMRMRERQEIRGFADRGTWKFKIDDVETVARSRQADSDPEVPIMPDKGNVEDEQPTTISRNKPHDADSSLFDDEDAFLDPLADSDSDVRLVGGPDVDLDFDSDSDVQLVGMEGDVSDLSGTLPETKFEGLDSDSDVKLVGPESDSDVSLADASSKLEKSDSDITLTGPTSEMDSDSDVHLMDSGTMPEMSLDSEDDDSGILPGESAILGAGSGAVNSKDSDSDVQLLGGDEDVMLIDESDDAVSIDLNSDSEDQSSVLADESGISLSGDSSLMLGGSGISLEGPSDSGISLGAGDDEGITLALDDDSGITLDAGDSGISLESMGDSGISLEGIGDSGISLEDDSFAGTIPMMDTLEEDDVAETQFEIPSIRDDEDSSYDLELNDDGSEDDTGVVDLVSSGSETLDDAVFDLDEDEESYESDSFAGDLELEDDVFDEEDELDVFDADEDVFDEGGEDQEYASPLAGGRMAATEQDWGTGTFIGLILASACMLLCGVVMLDLVKNTATAATPNPISGMVLDMLGGLYK